MPGFQWLFQGLISAFKKRSVQEPVKTNLKRQMKKIKNLTRKHPSGCCWLNCIFPSYQISMEAAIFRRPGLQTSGLPAVSLP